MRVYLVSRRYFKIEQTTNSCFRTKKCHCTFWKYNLAETYQNFQRRDSEAEELRILCDGLFRQYVMKLDLLLLPNFFTYNFTTFCCLLRARDLIHYVHQFIFVVPMFVAFLRETLMQLHSLRPQQKTVQPQTTTYLLHRVFTNVLLLLSSQLQSSHTLNQVLQSLSLFEHHRFQFLDSVCSIQ